jgi:hypothetical protein
VRSSSSLRRNIIESQHSGQQFQHTPSRWL